MKSVAALLDGIVLGLQYGLLGVGLTLIYGLAGVVNLAHGQIAIFGAIIAIVALDFLLQPSTGNLMLAAPGVVLRLGVGSMLGMAAGAGGIYTGSIPGQPASATQGSWPSRAHISSAVYGATRESMIATASAASRTAGSAAPTPESIALRAALTNSIVLATATLKR